MIQFICCFSCLLTPKLGTSDKLCHLEELMEVGLASASALRAYFLH